MGTFSLKGSSEYYLELSENPKRFDADSPVTNVFFDDTNGQVFTVRSGGITGVTVSGMDDSEYTSFTMEDKGPIVSIKFSLDHRVLAIQRNRENQNASVEFLNFQDLKPTNVEYVHTCKWKNAKILGFVWPKANEIALVTDHGIELLQVLAEKKVLKSLKSTSFSCAWFSWCAQSKILVLASNNGLLLQPFSLNSSTITKLMKLEMEAGPVCERDVLVVRVCDVTWCAVFRHAAHNDNAPTEVYLAPVSGAAGAAGAGGARVLHTGLVGRFAVHVLDHLIVVHHQSSQTSLLFDIMEECKVEGSTAVHKPVLPGISMRPAKVDGEPCPMYSGNWVVFQPNFMIDARLGCLWTAHLSLTGLVHNVPKDELPKLVSVLLRRTNGKEVVLRVVEQMVDDAATYLATLAPVFDEINIVYRKWVDSEVLRRTAGSGSGGGGGGKLDTLSNQRQLGVISQSDVCTHILQPRAEHKYIVQVITCYIASLCRHDVPLEPGVGELAASTRAALPRLIALVRRGCLSDGKALSCQLLSLAHLHPAAAQLALDMMSRLRAAEDITEVLLSYGEVVPAAGIARRAGAALAARKLLAAARRRPAAFVALYHALRRDADHRRPHPHDNADSFAELYKKLTSD